MAIIIPGLQYEPTVVVYILQFIHPKKGNISSSIKRVKNYLVFVNFFFFQGVCLKDKNGQAYCQCAGSFAGPNCEEKSEFAYISGGMTLFINVVFDLP